MKSESTMSSGENFIISQSAVAGAVDSTTAATAAAALNLRHHQQLQGDAEHSGADDSDYVIDSLNEALLLEAENNFSHLQLPYQQQQTEEPTGELQSYHRQQQRQRQQQQQQQEKQEQEVEGSDERDQDVVVGDIDNNDINYNNGIAAAGSSSLLNQQHEAASTADMPLSPRQGVSFREEFASLPDLSPNRQPIRSASPAPPFTFRVSHGVYTPVLSLIGPGRLGGDNSDDHPPDVSPFVNVTLNEFVGKEVPLLIGELPANEPDYADFWAAVSRLNVCAIITVNLLRGNKGCEPGKYSGTSLPWPNVVGTEAVFAHKVCARTLQIESFRSFQVNLVNVQDLDYGNEREITAWSYTCWPSSGHNVVPPLPHFFLDFLRTVIQQTYFTCRAGHPLLIVDRNGLDIAGLTAAVMMLLYQACEQRRADVWRCVADLRGACRRNVVSKFAMYEFLYDCLLQVMCATPTIMSGNFRRAFRHLLRRGPSLVTSARFGGGVGSGGVESTTRRVAPILEQFDLIGKLSSMYRGRVISKYSRMMSPQSANNASKRSQFEPRSFRGMRYYHLPSFTRAKHFLSIRGVIHVNLLLELMAKHCSRTLLWFSETPRADEILTGNQHEGVMIGEVSAYGTFYSFEMEAPTARGPWRVTVVQFVGWPAFSGERPARPCRELLLTLRRAIEHADAVAASFASLPSEPQPPPVVTMYETDAGCCTWRGAMSALAASLDQRMSRFLEVDVFRTAQLYKVYDPEAIIISTKQYTWCFKVAWSSYLMSNGKVRQKTELGMNDDEADEQQQQHHRHHRTDDLSDSNTDEIVNNMNADVNPYGSEKYLYSYPNGPSEVVVEQRETTATGFEVPMIQLPSQDDPLPTLNEYDRLRHVGHQRQYNKQQQQQHQSHQPQPPSHRRQQQHRRHAHVRHTQRNNNPAALKVSF